MRSFAVLFSLGLVLTSWQFPLVQKVAPTPPPTVSEPLPELLATKIALIQSEFQKAGLILQATPAYKEYQTTIDGLGKQMEALLTPFQKEHNCTIDQVAKTCVKAAK
jgi:hypothetical protein